MRTTYLRFLLAMLIAAVPASAAYTLLGYYLVPGVSGKGSLSAPLFMFFFTFVLIGAVFLGSVLYALLLRKGFTVTRYLAVPVALAVVWLGGAVVANQPVTSAIPFASCMVILGVASYAVLAALTIRSSRPPSAAAELGR